jgi:hypothetical protein
MQNFSHAFSPNFLQNITEIPNSMGMGYVSKILEKIPVESGHMTYMYTVYFQHKTEPKIKNFPNDIFAKCIFVKR